MERQERMKKRMPWTDAEQRLLAQEWPRQGIECAPLFTRHSRRGVLARAYMLGLRFGRPTGSVWAEKRGTRSCGSGQFAGYTYRGVLCREALEKQR